MKSPIATVLATLCLAAAAGCDSRAEPSAAERSWSLTNDGVLLHMAAGSARSIALPGWLWVAEPHCPPAIAVGPAGAAVVTSNVVATLWRIDPQTLSVTVHPLDLNADTDKDVGFAAIAYSDEQKAFVAYSEQRSVWKIDAELKHGAKIADADLGRAGLQRSRNMHVPCGALAQRLSRFAATPYLSAP